MKELKKQTPVTATKDFTSETVTEYHIAIQNLRKTGEDLKNDTLRFIGILKKIQAHGWYRIDGYKTIEELVEKELCFSRTTTYQYMKIGTRFMEEKDGTFVLKDAFKNYGISQLMELCPCEENTILERFSPDMTIREIRNIKKDLSSTKPKTSEKQTTKTEVRQPIYELELYGLKDYQMQEDDILVQIYQAISAHPDQAFRILIDYSVQ